jgi:hypothetical protein
MRKPEIRKAFHRYDSAGRYVKPKRQEKALARRLERRRGKKEARHG